MSGAGEGAQGGWGGGRLKRGGREARGGQAPTPLTHAAKKMKTPHCMEQSMDKKHWPAAGGGGACGGGGQR